MHHYTEKQLEEADYRRDQIKDRYIEARNIIETASNTIKAVALLGGKYSPLRIDLPCGRTLLPLPCGIWELAYNFEVALGSNESPRVLAARIRKLLVRHDEFLTSQKNTAK